MPSDLNLLRRHYGAVTIVDTKGFIFLSLKATKQSLRKGGKKDEMRPVVGARGISYLQRLWRTRTTTTTSTGTRSISTGEENDGDEVVQSSKVKIFDRNLKRKQRDRAAWLMRPKDSLVDTVVDNLLDRLEDCKKTFPTALCLGGSLEAIRRLLRGRGAIEKLIMMDTSYDMVKLCKDAEKDAADKNIETSFLVGDEEFLPIKDRMALKPDGLFLAAILGGETLKELRIACTVAQIEREGGISPRLSPLAQVRDAGNLLTRAGFNLPGVDVDEYTVRYNSALELIEHLRAMGETNALLQRNNLLKRETALATAAIYESMFASEDGTIPATFQVIYMTGWKEHHSQQKAKRRGSATISFKDIQEQFSEGTSG